MGNIMELLIPYVSYLYKYRNEVKKATGHMSQPENEYLLDKVLQIHVRWLSLYIVGFVSLYYLLVTAIYSLFHKRIFWLRSTTRCRRHWRTMQRLRSDSATQLSSFPHCPW